MSLFGNLLKISCATGNNFYKLPFSIEDPLKDVNIEKEYSLIVEKKSKLSSAKRAMVVRYYKRSMVLNKL